jgi:hypothetical protein
MTTSKDFQSLGTTDVSDQGVLNIGALDLGFVWNLVLGIWCLEFGAWDLVLGIWICDHDRF